MLSWLLGYKQEDDEQEKDAKKIEDNDDDLSDIPPPPELKREQGYYKECKVDEVIKWADYDFAIAEIRKELKQLKIESDEKWKARLSPALQTRSVRKKRRKKSTSASSITEK